MSVDPDRIRSAWQGRVSGCLLGKPLEVLSFRSGSAGVREYLRAGGAWPLRDYAPLIENSWTDQHVRACCRGHISRAEPDDDIDYTVMALLLLETHGACITTADVARAWLRLLPAGRTWTAEREAYRVLLESMNEQFVNGEDPGFDLAKCSDNPFNEWIGGQIRVDMYGWTCPGRPALAADLARRDAGLSHRGEGLNAAAFIAALGASIPVAAALDAAIDMALQEIPADSRAAEAVEFGRRLAGRADAVTRLHRHYEGFSPIHSINNLALVVWALCAAKGDFSVAIGEAVAAGWDTDCNGATVGGLCGLMVTEIPEHWTQPWNGRVATALAGQGELALDDLVARTVEVSRRLH